MGRGEPEADWQTTGCQSIKRKTNNKSYMKEPTQQRSSTIPQSGSSSTIPEGEGGGGGGWGSGSYHFSRTS